MFDPYHKWLGIPPTQQPPTYYRLLGIELFEADREVIEAAANQRMAYLQEVAGGDRIRESQRLLNEVATARRCLLNTEKKAEYDAQLRSKMEPDRSEPPRPAFTEPDRSASPPAIMETEPTFAIPTLNTPALREPARPRAKPVQATSRRWWYIGGVAGAVLVLVIVGVLASRGGNPETKTVARDDRPEPVKVVPKEEEPPKKNPPKKQETPNVDCHVHWAPKRNLNGEPVGFFSHAGAYHLFYQPSTLTSNQDRWAYAVSKDLLSWAEKPVKHPALFPTSAKLVAVLPDYNNSSGLATGKNVPFVACYAVPQPGQKKAKTNDTLGLHLAYSTDQGATWTGQPQPMLKFPIQPELRVNLVRHESSQLWVVLALRVSTNAKMPDGDLELHTSKDLKTWTKQANQKLPTGNDQPDLLEVPVQGDPKKMKTVLVAGNGQYYVGQFDGKTITREGAAGGATWRQVRGTSTLINPQSSAGRTLQIAHGPAAKAGENSPFCWPHELTVVQNAKNQTWRLLRHWPKELQTLRGKDQPFKDLIIGKGSKALDGVKGSVFEFAIELEKQNANEFTLVCGGEKLRYAFDKNRWYGEGYEVVNGDGKTTHLAGVVDGGVVEFHFGPYVGTAVKQRVDHTAKPLEIVVTTGQVKVKSLVVWELRPVPVSVAAAP